VEYRTSDGLLKSQGEIRALNKNVSIPKVWTADVCASLNINPVLEAPKPKASGAYKQVVRDGVVKDGDNWVQAWTETDMFADTTDKDGKKITKAEQERVYQAKLDADASAAVRTQRDGLLKDTDFYALSDVTMTDAMTSYRQALRDITTHSAFPNLTNDDWPTAP